MTARRLFLSGMACALAGAVAVFMGAGSALVFTLATLTMALCGFAGAAAIHEESTR